MHRFSCKSLQVSITLGKNFIFNSLFSRSRSEYEKIVFVLLRLVDLSGHPSYLIGRSSGLSVFSDFQFLLAAEQLSLALRTVISNDSIFILSYSFNWQAALRFELYSAREVFVVYTTRTSY